MSQNAAELAAEVERRNKELTSQIDELLEKQIRLQAEISKLQRERDPANATRLEELKSTRKDTGTMIGVLATNRTELLDGLPVITDAAGELDVIAEDLAKDAALIEDVAKRIKKVTKAIGRAEKLIVKAVSLLKPLIL